MTTHLHTPRLLSALALLALVAYKLWIYPEGRPTFLLLVTPQLCSPPALTLVNVPDGGLAWP